MKNPNIVFPNLREVEIYFIQKGFEKEDGDSDEVDHPIPI